MLRTKRVYVFRVAHQGVGYVSRSQKDAIITKPSENSHQTVPVRRFVARIIGTTALHPLMTMRFRLSAVFEPQSPESYLDL